MIQSVSSLSDTYLSTISAASSTVIHTSEAEDEKKSMESQSPLSDTVEISEQARAAIRQSTVVAVASSKTDVTAEDAEKQSAQSIDQSTEQAATTAAMKMEASKGSRSCHPILQSLPMKVQKKPTF